MVIDAIDVVQERRPKIAGRVYPQLPLADFNMKLAGVLPKLIGLLTSDEIRAHPTWGKELPFHVPHYGTGISPGHCIRPDVLFTASGPKICELDFVPSGRGYLLAGLDPKERVETAKVFATWYEMMKASKIFYATASTTMCREETEAFSKWLRDYCGTDISAGNIDAVDERALSGALIDRLSYRSEMSAPEEKKSLAGLTVATAEPYLDSKAIFALIHDRSMSSVLKKALGSEGFEFLRSVVPNTMFVKSLSDADRWKIANEQQKWVIKSTEVETDNCWGCRGTIPGAGYSSSKFYQAMNGIYPPNKNSGSNPIIQEWSGSKDFWPIWDDVILGKYERSEMKQKGKLVADKAFNFHTREVGARIGFYFLVVRGSNDCLVTPYGDLILRQDRLVHGATDAICLTVKPH